MKRKIISGFIGTGLALTLPFVLPSAAQAEPQLVRNADSWCVEDGTSRYESSVCFPINQHTNKLDRSLPVLIDVDYLDADNEQNSFSVDFDARKQESRVITNFNGCKVEVLDSFTTAEKGILNIHASKICGEGGQPIRIFEGDPAIKDARDKANIGNEQFNAAVRYLGYVASRTP